MVVVVEVEKRCLADGGDDVGVEAVALSRSHCCLLAGGEGPVGWDCTIGAAVAGAGAGDVEVGGVVAVVDGDVNGVGGAAVLDGTVDCGRQFQSIDGLQEHRQEGIACAGAGHCYLVADQPSWGDCCNDDGDGVVRMLIVALPLLPFLDRYSLTCCRSKRICRAIVRTPGGSEIT